MKCLEKDRARRYETASGLASDIQRHLNNEPVVACPPSDLYRFQKLVRRNKLVFAAGAGIAAALVIGLAIALWQFAEKTRAYHRAVAAEQEAVAARTRAEAHEKNAQTEAAKSRQVAQFLAEMFHGVGPSVALGRDTTVLKEILDNAAERIGKELTDQPEVEIALRSNLAEAYNELGLYQEEKEIARKSLELARARFPAESAPVAEALFQMGMALNGLGQLKEAEAAQRESVEILRKLLAAQRVDPFGATNAPADHFQNLFPAGSVGPDSLYQSLSELGHVFYNQGEYAQAETTYRESLALARKLRGDEHRDVAVQLSGLGLNLREQGKLAEAEAMLRECLAIHRKLYSGKDHPALSISLNNLALVLQSQGKLDNAESVFVESLDMTKRVFGAESLDVADLLHNLATVAHDKDQLAEAESRERDAIAIARRLGNDDSFLARTLNRLGEILRDAAKLDDAQQMVSEALALRRKLLGNDNVSVADSLASFASILERQGKLAGAEPLCRECLAIRETKTPDHWRVSEARSLLGASLVGQKKYADAEPLLLSSYEGMKQREDKVPTAIRSRLKAALLRLVKFNEETGRPERAAEWKRKLAEFQKSEAQPKTSLNRE